MPSQKVGNPKTPTPQTPEMNDCDFLTDILSTTKYITSSYATALHEASNNTLYQVIKKIYDETQQSQRELYNLMFEKGWYQLEKAEQQKIQQAHVQYTAHANQFPYK